jgi:hypothetical protein
MVWTGRPGNSGTNIKVKNETNETSFVVFSV